MGKGGREYRGVEWGRRAERKHRGSWRGRGDGQDSVTRRTRGWWEASRGQNTSPLYSQIPNPQVRLLAKIYSELPNQHTWRGASIVFVGTQGAGHFELPAAHPPCRLKSNKAALSLFVSARSVSECPCHGQRSPSSLCFLLVISLFETAPSIELRCWPGFQSSRRSSVR